MTTAPGPGERDAVVLVHGLWMHGVVTTLLQRRLAERYGFRVEVFSYPSLGEGLEANTRRLVACLREQPGPRVHLVGHSLGGVLALHGAAATPELPPGRIVCLGSPLTGSRAAAALRRWPGGETLLGATLSEAVLERPFTRVPVDREVGVIAGRIGFGGGLLLNALEPPHDGAVAVAETRLPGIADHLVLPVSHSGMLLSPAVAAETAHFLRHGRFGAG